MRKGQMETVELKFQTCYLLQKKNSFCQNFYKEEVSSWYKHNFSEENIFSEKAAAFISNQILTLF
jgi:hypothetical protein